MFTCNNYKFLALGLLVILGKGAFADFVEDYCWRDFDDVIPKDALIAGEARDGLPIYVGQVLYQNKLIPGKIHHNTNEIHIEFKTAHVLNETIKILCTYDPQKFVWVKTNTNDLLSLNKTRHIFEGGYEQGVLTYIGRTVSHGELTVGKVICWVDSHCIPLTTIEDGRWFDYSQFEILTYNDTVEPAVTSLPKVETTPELKVETTPEPKVETTPGPKVETTPEPKVETTPEPKVDPIPEPEPIAQVRVTSKPDIEVEQVKKPAPIRSKFTRGRPQLERKASPLAIFLLIAFMVIAAAVIVLLVRRC